MKLYVGNMPFSMDESQLRGLSPQNLLCITAQQTFATSIYQLQSAVVVKSKDRHIDLAHDLLKQSSYFKGVKALLA